MFCRCGAVGKKHPHDGTLYRNCCRASPSRQPTMAWRFTFTSSRFR